MRKLLLYMLLPVFLLVFRHGFIAQNQLSQWYFGNHAALNFMSSPPASVLSSVMNSSAGSASIADAAGNLLFYTDGQTVWNKNNVVMANGTGLISASTNQSPVIVKQPGNSNIYFIFSLTSTSVYYSTVDMSLAAGLGSVTVQNTVISSGLLMRSGLTAARHCNGRDLWLLTSSQTSFPITAVFRVFAITATGVNITPVISPSLPLCCLSTELKVSPDGKRLAVVNNNAPSLAEFDNSTGSVFNHFLLTSQVGLPACSDMEFSPDATKLYTGISGGYLVQWDMCGGSNAAIYASRDSMLMSNNGFGRLRLAIDGKIYATSFNSSSLDVINSPNQLIASCNYVQGGQSIAPNTHGGRLPNFESGFMHAAPQTPAFTYTVSNSFGCQTASFTAMPVIQNFTTVGCSVVGYSLTHLAWNFGDPNSGAANTSTLTSAGHHFSMFGTYTVQLILYYSCSGANDTLSAVVQVNQPCVSAANGGILCSSLGSATVTSLVGTGPFSYTWMPTGQTSPVATSLAPGVYTITVQDVTGSTFSTTTVLSSAIPFTGTVSASNSVICYGASSGTANIVTSGGTGNETYLWTNGLASYTTASVAGLPAGSWSVTVTDALTHCTTDSVFLVTQPPPIHPVASPGASICTGVSLTLNGSSAGYAGIVYSWQPTVSLSSGNTLTVIASPTISTIYTLTGTFNGCSESITDTVDVVSPPNLNVSLNSATACAEALNGSANTITLTAGGATTYTISTPNDIYNSNPSGPITNLNTLPPHIPGMSTATVYGSNGVCTVSATAVFSIIPNPTISISNPTPVICAGQSFTYTVDGANSYVWSSSTPGQTLYTTGNIAVADPTTNAVFSVFGGSLGCNSAMQSTTITVIPVPHVQVNSAIICSGSQVLLTALGTGTQYSWNPASWLSAGNGATVYANPPLQQSYTVTASLGSCTNEAVATVAVLPLPVPTITAVRSEVCMNETIELQGSGGVAYFWNGPFPIPVQGQSLNINAFSPYYSGIYTLTVRDQNNCTGIATQSITVRSLPDGYFNPAGMQGCAPFLTDLLFQATPGSSSITTLNWRVNNSSFSGNSFSYLFTQAGNYLVSGNLVDIYGCVNTMTAFVTVYPKPRADFSFTPVQPVENMEEVQFRDQSTGATSFSWEFKDQHHRSGSEHPAFLFEDAGTYPVALLVKNEWYCSDTIVKTITVAPDFVVYVPNAFTPNDDDKNELFRPVMRGAHHFTFSVFDRWGELLFETSDISNGWDGTYKSQPCQQDTYVWKLVLSSEGNDMDAKQERELAGQVLLYR